MGISSLFVPLLRSLAEWEMHFAIDISRLPALASAASPAPRHFQLNPPGPRFFGRISASLPRPAPNAFGAGASLAPPNSPKLLVAIVKPYRLHNTKH